MKEINLELTISIQRYSLTIFDLFMSKKHKTAYIDMLGFTRITTEYTSPKSRSLLYFEVNKSAFHWSVFFRNFRYLRKPIELTFTHDGGMKEGYEDVAVFHGNNVTFPTR